MSTKNSSVCAIYGCKNKNQQKLRKHLFFYRFPKVREFAQKWVRSCNSNKLMDLLESQGADCLYKQRYMVCSDHFEWKCFRKRNLLSKGLIETAVPTKNLHPKIKVSKSCSENSIEMRDIKIKIELQICHGCLSIDRITSPLGHLCEIFHTLIGSMTSNETPIYFCWECIAVLRRLQRFQNQLKQAHDTLKQIFDDARSLSKLSISQKDYYDLEIDHSDYIANHPSHNNTFVDHKDDLKKRKDDLEERKDDLEDHKDDPKDHNDDLKYNKDEYLDIKEEDPVNGKTEIKHPSNFVEALEVDTEVTDNNIDFDDPFDQNSNRSDKDVYTPNNSIPNAKRKLKIMTNIKKEYKSYAIQRCQNDWKKPYTQYFTKVYLDEVDIEANFLQKDRKRQGRKMNFKCETCLLIYARKIDLDRHNNLNHHKPNTPYKCLHCKKVQPSLERLKEHWRSHSEFYKCDACGRVVFPCSLALHLSRSHINVYACTYCTLTFSSLASFSDHYKNHPFVCDYCNKKCALKSVLEKHIKNHHTPHSCVTCDRNFDSYRMYRAHCREMHPDVLNIGAEPEICYCVECDRQFPSRALYMKHINSKHTLKQWTPKKRPCPECGKAFNKNSDMLLHYNYSHVKVTKFHCNLCDKYFLKMYGLRIHMENVHLKLPKPKNKICDLCGRGFQNNTVLDNHRRTHTGERPFKCGVCPAAFAQKGAMKIHQRKQHNT